MAKQGGSAWSNVNTLFEIGIELYQLTHPRTGAKSADKGMEVEQIADGVLLMSNDKDVLLAVSGEKAALTLSDTARGYGEKKGDYLCYPGALSAIPLYELSRINEDVRERIVSEESLRATLCGNYPEYVKTHNMTSPPGAWIEDADAPPYLFLQKQLDLAADATRNEVSEFQAARAREADNENSVYEDVLELER